MGEEKDDKTHGSGLGRATPESASGGPFLNEVDDSESGRFGPPANSATDMFQPGVIEVEFKKSPFTGLSVENFSQQTEAMTYPQAWSNTLRETLDKHGLQRWSLSFPLLYPWSNESPEKALEFYLASGRDRHLTFHFSSDANLVDIARELGQLSEIAHAAPVPKLAPPSSAPNDPLLGNSDQLTTTVCGPTGCLDNQWYIFRCGANRAWRKASGSGVILADIDWGFNLFHEELNTPRVEFTFNTFENSPIVAHGNRLAHGTAVLGLAAAGVNTRGMLGFAHGATVWAIQAGSDSVEDHAFWVSAIDLVRSRSVQGRRKVMVLEIQTKQQGNIEMSGTIRKAIIDAIASGVIVCVPAGNGGRDAGIGDDGQAIPATGSLLVGATRYGDRTNVRSHSNIGDRIVIYAPGDVEHDLTCSDGGISAYRNRFGATSGATAKVAGTVALMLQVNPHLTNAQVRTILRRSRLPVTDSSSNPVGFLLNTEQAVSEASLSLSGCLSRIFNPLRASSLAR